MIEDSPLENLGLAVEPSIIIVSPKVKHVKYVSTSGVAEIAMLYLTLLFFATGMKKSLDIFVAPDLSEPLIYLYIQ